MQPKAAFILFAFLYLTLNAIAQDSLNVDTPRRLKQTKTNPIIFSDFHFGWAFLGADGLYGGFNINYQYKKNLFTLRYNAIADLAGRDPQLRKLQIIAIEDQGHYQEYGMLYGRRYLTNTRGLSFSAGASFNYRVRKYPNAGSSKTITYDYYPGLPFELNVNWFKGRKRRFRIYHIIPVGEPTAFGASIGFKLHGNVSKNPYLALGIVYGLGMFKHYDNESAQNTGK